MTRHEARDATTQAQRRLTWMVEWWNMLYGWSSAEVHRKLMNALLGVPNTK